MIFLTDRVLRIISCLFHIYNLINNIMVSRNRLNKELVELSRSKDGDLII